jgi:hypothetical protein
LAKLIEFTHKTGSFTSKDVTLRWEEYRKAAKVGFERHYRATQRGYKGNVPHAWTQDIEGACAEAAVNKFLFDRPEPAKDDTWGGADLPFNVEGEELLAR